MTGLRFSLVRLLVGMLIVALLLGTARAFVPEASLWSIMFGGLNLCTLVFAGLCAIMGNNTARTILLSLVFYLWGCFCLIAGDLFDLTFSARLLLATLGSLYATWAWLGIPSFWSAHGNRAKTD